MKITRLEPGKYDVLAAGRLFEIEQTAHGDWQLVEISEHGTRNYWNHFPTKRDALDALRSEH